MFYSLFLYGNIACIVKNIQVRNGGKVRMGKSTHAMEGHSKRACAYDGGEGSKIFYFGA